MRHIISPNDLNLSELDELLNLWKISSKIQKYSEACHRKSLRPIL